MSDLYISDDLVKKTILDAKVYLKPSDISVNTALQQKLDGKCNNGRYIISNSIKINNPKNVEFYVDSMRSDCQIYSKNMRINSEVVNICRGSIIKCQVLGINDFGLNTINGPINIIVVSENKNNQDKFKINDIIKVKIITFKSSMNGTCINAYATLYDENDTDDIKNDNIEDLEDISDYSDDDEEDDDQIENDDLEEDNLEEDNLEEDQEEEDQE